MHEAQSHVFEVIMIIIVCSQVTSVFGGHQCGQLFSSATGRQRGNAYRATKGSPPPPPPRKVSTRHRNRRRVLFIYPEVSAVGHAELNLITVTPFIVFYTTLWRN